MNNLETMVTIQSQADADHDLAGIPPLNDETRELAEGTRWTFDIVETPIDPLR